MQPFFITINVNEWNYRAKTTPPLPPPIGYLNIGQKSLYSHILNTLFGIMLVLNRRCMYVPHNNTARVYENNVIQPYQSYYFDSFCNNVKSSSPIDHRLLKRFLTLRLLSTWAMRGT